MQNIWGSIAQEYVDQSQVYTSAKYIGEYDGEEVYELLTEKPAIIGLHIILIKDGEYRLEDNNEAYSIIEEVRKLNKRDKCIMLKDIVSLNDIPDGAHIVWKG